MKTKRYHIAYGVTVTCEYGDGWNYILYTVLDDEKILFLDTEKELLDIMVELDNLPELPHERLLATLKTYKRLKLNGVK